MSAVDDRFITDLATKIAGQLGGKVGIAPRVFLRQLIDVMDKVDLYADYDPRREALGETGALTALTEEEQAAIRRGDVRTGSTTGVDDIDLGL